MLNDDRWAMLRAVAVALLVTISTYAGPTSAAPDADACLSSYEQTQRMRKAGKLLEAEAQAIVCASESCPKILQEECVTWLEEIQRAIPQVTVRATGPSGCDLSEARLVVDGSASAERLDGRPLRLDPGAHAVRVELEDGSAREQYVVVAEGERGRRIDLSFAPPGAICGQRVAERRTRSPLTYVVGGVGAAAVIVGGAFSIAAWSKESDLSGCRPRCDPSDVRDMRATFIAGDVLVVTGIALLGLATYLWLTPSRPAKAALERPLATF